MNKTQLCVLALLAGTALPAAAQIDTTLARHDAFVKAGIATGAGKDFTRAQSTAAVTTISGFAKVFKDASRVLEVKK